MPHVETGVVEVQQWQHIRRPVVRTESGVYLLDHPYWISQAGRTVSVRIINADQFAEVVEEEQTHRPPGHDQGS
jgi:hypothetical protein